MSDMVTSIEEILGKTWVDVFTTEDVGDSILVFMGDREAIVFRHVQECCESVDIEDIDGVLSDLAGSPITLAEEVVHEPEEVKRLIGDDSETWTFYKFATIAGHATVRWVGSSNGYYSETVGRYRVTRRSCLDALRMRKANLVEWCNSEVLEYY